jgi:hypothetical protein
MMCSSQVIEGTQERRNSAEKTGIRWIGPRRMTKIQYKTESDEEKRYSLYSQGELLMLKTLKFEAIAT